MISLFFYLIFFLQAQNIYFNFKIVPPIIPVLDSTYWLLRLPVRISHSGQKQESTTIQILLDYTKFMWQSTYETEERKMSRPNQGAMVGKCK